MPDPLTLITPALFSGTRPHDPLLLLESYLRLTFRICLPSEFQYEAET